MKMDWRLIKRSFTSLLDEEDRWVLEAWLGESERHRQLYEEMKRFVVRRENFQLSMEMKKQFKQEFDLKIDEAYRRRGRRVWLQCWHYPLLREYCFGQGNPWRKSWITVSGLSNMV